MEKLSKLPTFTLLRGRGCSDADSLVPESITNNQDTQLPLIRKMFLFFTIKNVFTFMVKCYGKLGHKTLEVLLIL